MLFPILTFGQLQDINQADPALPEVIPPSPTVANLMHFEEVPVDTYTGQPDISIPIYTKKINRDLALPLALRYSTLGLRIQERSGWVGTGWSLEAGGTISRTVRGGVADEQVHTNEIPGTGILQNPAFWDYQQGSLSDSEKKEFLWNANGTKSQKYDSQPDLFQFSMLGMSGRFAFGAVEEGGVGPVLLSLDKQFKVATTWGTGSNGREILGFVITDTNGYQYVFGNGVTETSTSTPVTSTWTQDGTYQPPLSQTYDTVTTSAWHLVSIRDQNNEELVSFTYTNSEESYTTPLSITENKLSPISLTDVQKEIPYNQGLLRPSKALSYYDIVTQTKKLQSIDFKDGTSIYFEAGGSHPETNGVYLGAINLHDKQGLSFRAFNLEYTTTSQNNRLWLDKVTIAKPLQNSGQSYLLDYFEREDLPGIDGGYDGWGYNIADYRFNGSPSGAFNYYDYDAIKRGVLTSITKPTGGIMNFTFEPHTFMYERDTVLDDFIQNPMNSETVDPQFSNFFKVGVCTDSDTDIDDGGQNIRITHAQSVRVQMVITKNGGVPTQDEIDDYDIVNGQDIAKFSGITSLRIEGTLDAGGTYNVDYPIDELDDGREFIQVPAGNFRFKVVLNSTETLASCAYDKKHIEGYTNIKYVKAKDRYSDDYQNYLLGGGLRIKYIDFVEPLDVTNPLKKRMTYDYHFSENRVAIDGLEGGPQFEIPYVYLGSTGVVN